MCYTELQNEELQQEIIYLKQYHLKEKCKWIEERDNLNEIIEEIKSCLYVEKIPDDCQGEASSFYET